MPPVCRLATLPGMLHIISVGRNFAGYVERLVDSLKQQTVTEWCCHIYDDASDDDSLAAVRQLVQDDPRFTTHAVDSHRPAITACYNLLWDFNTPVRDTDICLLVNPADWLADGMVLARVQQYYADPATQMTTGSFSEWAPAEQTYLAGAEYIERGRQLVASGQWDCRGADIFGPLVTFRASLFCDLGRTWLREPQAADIPATLAAQAGCEHVQFVTDHNYVVCQPARDAARPAAAAPRIPGHKTVCLNMIVKNEGARLRRLFENVRPLIDYWVIVDTGSTDDTLAVLQEFQRSVPGEIHQRPWQNFGANRTESIGLARDKADYLLLLDADDTLNFTDAAFKAVLTGDGYYVHHTGPVDFVLPRLVSGRRPWYFAGVTHEYLTSNEVMHWQQQDWITITHHADGGCRDDKFTRDIALLEQGLLTEPANTRYMFYLAQSYKDLGQVGKAREWYARRAAAGGWDQEIYVSKLQFAKLAESDPAVDPLTIPMLYLAAHQFRPSRIEALFELTRYCRQQEHYQLGVIFGREALKIGYPADLLFVHREAHEWQLQDELGICEYWVGNYARSREIYVALLASGTCPLHQRGRIEENLGFAKRALGEV